MNPCPATHSLLAICAVCAAAGDTKAQSAPVAGVRPPVQVIIRLASDDACQIGQTQVNLSELPLALKGLAGLPEKPEVVVRADEGVSYGNVVKVLDACQAASLDHVSFAATQILTAQDNPSLHAIPADVQASASHLREWLNTLDGKTEAEIAAAIGSGYEKDTWKLQGRDELRIRYKFGKKSTLLLLFQGSKVVKAEIYVMSE